MSLAQNTNCITSCFAGAFAKLRKATLGCIMSVCPSARPHGTTRPPTGQIFMKFCIWIFFENMSRNFKFSNNRTWIAGTLREDPSTFMIIFRSVLLRMRNTSDKSCTENQNTHFVFSNFLFFENLTVSRKSGARRTTHGNTTHAHCTL